MLMPSTLSRREQDHYGLLTDSDLLPRHRVFCARDLEAASEYLCSAIAPNRLTYSTRQHGLDFRHRLARLGAVELNAMQFGGEVTVVVPHVPDFYLLQIMLAGSCALTQGGRSCDMPASSVAVINSGRPFTKKWSSGGASTHDPD